KDFMYTVPFPTRRSSDLMYISNQQGMHFVQGSQGHIWDLTLVDDLIVCGHNLGTYQIRDKQWELISSNNGGYDFKPVRGMPDTRSEEHTSELQSRENLVC